MSLESLQQMGDHRDIQGLQVKYAILQRLDGNHAEKLPCLCLGYLAWWLQHNAHTVG